MNIEWRIRSIKYANGEESHFVEGRSFNIDGHPVWAGQGGAHPTFEDAKKYLDRCRIVSETYTEIK